MRKLRADQREAIKFLYEQDQSMLFADIGTGKTVIALTVLQMWRKHGVAKRAIVFGPSRVCNDVWRQEVGEWPHLIGDVQSVAGKSDKVRRAVLEDPKVDVVCVNYENIPWLIKNYPDGVPGVDVLWFDEVDKMKSPTSLRFRGRGRKDSKTWVQGMRHWREHFKILVGMTGTPVSNGLLDLWAQIYCVDGGERLGSDYDQYKRRYFYQSDWAGFQFKVYPDAVDTIHGMIEDAVFRIEAGSEVPDTVHTPPRYVDLPPQVMKQYRGMEREYVMEFDGGDQTVAMTAAAVYNKLRQVVGGFVYDQQDASAPRITRMLHDKKLLELDSIISELNGAQLMIAYQFKEQAEQLLARYGKRLECIGGSTSTADGSHIIDRWNAGDLPLLAVQPQSAGHGLNLQKSGAHHICMLTEPESAGLFNQVVGRLARTGQKNTVFVHTIHARGTIDEDRACIVTSKRDTLRATLDAIKERQERENV